MEIYNQFVKSIDNPMKNRVKIQRTGNKVYGAEFIKQLVLLV